MGDPAERFLDRSSWPAPIRHVPVIDRIGAGTLREVTGYRVIRDTGLSGHLLILTQEGHGLVGAATERVNVGPGDVVVYQPGAPHDYGVDPSHGVWDIAFSHFESRPDWAPLLRWPEPVPGVHRLHLDTESFQRVAEGLLAAVRWARSGHPRAALLALNALEQALVWCDGANPRSGRLDTRITRALVHLDSKLTEAHTVASVARAANLSPSRFAHLFTEQLGVAPMTYLERQRMTQAKMYLDNSDQSIAAVARLVGFLDPLYFSTRFRHVVGTSPQQYRALHRRSGGADANSQSRTPMRRSMPT